MDEKRQPSKRNATPKNNISNRRSARQSNYTKGCLDESKIYENLLMKQELFTPKKRGPRKVEEEQVCSPPKRSLRSRKEVSETPKKVTFEKGRKSQPETPKIISARAASRSRSLSRAKTPDRLKSDIDATYEPKTPDRRSTTTRVCQSARAVVRARTSIYESATPKRSARELRSSFSSEDEKLTRSKALTNEKTPKKKPLVDQNNTGLTPALEKMRLRRENNEYRVVQSFGFVDDNDENSQDSDEEYKVRSTRKTPKKKTEPKTPSSVKRKLDVDGATPKRLSLRRNLLTPSMKERTLPIAKAATPLQEARRRLHVSAVPKSLPCREEEFNNIFSFLRSKILDESSGCMYISGVPGTGKTATVNETVRGLRKLVELGEIDDFNFVSVNGMKLSEPRQAYVQILKQLDDKSLTWEQAQRALEKKFKGKGNRKMTLLLVDELDMLCTKRQDVVYNLLDWPANVNARLVVVTIANTMDLPEKILKKRVNSRLGMTRLTFEPYNFLQLQQIVLSRLKTLKSFEPEAVEFIARKVASVSGDARRALDICRRATEIAEVRGRELVTMKDVREGIAEMISNPKIQAIRNCRKFELLFLRAVTNEILLSGVEETRFDRVHTQFENICKLEGMKVPNVTIALGICARLGASRLLVTEHSRADIYQKILLNVTPDDVQFATKEDFSD